MKKALLIAGALLALSATFANAQLNLAYTDCASGLQNANFACNVNTGFSNLIGSYIAPAGTTAITGAEGVIDFQADAPALPLWWQFGTGTCRPTSLQVQYNTPGATCVDYWGSIPGGALGGYGYFVGFGGANRGRLKTVSAVDGTAAAPLNAGDEVYAFTIKIDRLKTVGTGFCEGCQVGVCIIFNSLKLTQGVGIGDYLLTSPAISSAVSWQGGGSIGGDCYGATPTKSSSWGQVKSLYR